MSYPARKGLAFWIASGFGSGLAPKAPGTVGSLTALLPWLLLRELPVMTYLLAVLAVFLLGVWACSVVIRDLRSEDPGVAVIDEWIGMWITLCAAPAGWIWPVVGFALFRLFDIWKPWPVRWVDHHVGGGFGAMADDALAGLFALASLQLAVHAWARWA